MIIYGTGLFNRREHSLVRATCSSCGRVGYHKSYTCSRFFTLYFVPVIFLGKYKVTRQCPHCRHTLGMPHRQWVKLRREELARAVSHYEANPSDEGAATEALGAVTALQSRLSLLRIGPVIRTALARNPVVIGSLAEAYSHLCMDKEADEAYLHAVSLSDDERLAARAKSHIELQQLPKPKPPHRLLQSLPVLIVPVALLFAGTTYLQKAARAELTQAHVLNGLDQPYRFILNGETITLRPFQRTLTNKLVYGKNEIKPVPDHPYIVGHTFSVDVPWYRRPFVSPVVIVNPDRAGIVMWERTGYASSNFASIPNQVEIQSGRPYYVYESLDFPFQSFPETISMSSKTSIVYRTRVAELRDLPVEQVGSLFLKRNDRESLHGYLRARLADDRDDMRVILAAAYWLPRDEFIGKALERLEDRPVRLQWHRAYQNLVKGTPEGIDLESRYRAYVHREPDDSQLAYLLGRVFTDPDEQRVAWEHAAALPRPTGYAVYGLGYHYLLEGDFARAAIHAGEAMRIDPANEQFRALRQSIRYGIADYAALEREWEESFRTRTPSYADFHQHVFHLGRLGRSAEARVEVLRYLQRMEQQNPMSETDRNQGAAYLESALALAAYDRIEYAMWAARIDAPAWRFQSAVMKGNLDEATTLANHPENGFGAHDHMMLYVLHMQKSQPVKAAVHLDKTITILSEGRAEQRRWEAWLKGADAPTPREAAHACDDPEHHFLYLLALAYRHPDYADGYLERARTIAFRDSFYSLATKELLGR